MKTIKENISKGWRLFSIMAVMIAAFSTLSSCGDDYWVNDPLYGTWQLTGVSYYDTNEFEFDGNGLGYYYAYNSMGDWDQWPITYNIYGNRLTVYVESTGQVWNYTYQFYGSGLTLYNVDYPSSPLYYQRVY